MASLNKVFLMGNLTRDPALRFTPGGAAVCEFGLAMNRKYVSNGQEREDTCFVDIIVWGKQAESCGRFLEKGSSALIEGRLQYDQWEDKQTGAKRSRLRVTAERVQFLSSAQGSGQSSRQQNYGQENSSGDAGGYNNNSRDNNYGQNSSPQPPKNERFQQDGNNFPPPPPMPSNEAFNVDDDMEDDIPF